MSGVPREVVSEGAAAGRSQIEFDDNLLLPLLYGERDQHLDRIERQLGVSLVPRGNRLTIAGPASSGGQFGKFTLRNTPGGSSVLSSRSSSAGASASAVSHGTTRSSSRTL